MWYSFWQEMYLSADGAFYFARILENGSFLNYSWTRLHSDIATQLPLVLAIKFGVTSLGILKFLYALGLYFPYLASITLSAYALRGMDPNGLVFPLAGYLLVSFPAAYIWAGESQVMAVATWPVLFLLLRPSLTRVDVALLISLLVFLSRTYETVVGATVVFMAIILMRLLRGPTEQRKWFLLALGAALFVFGVSVYSAIFPASYENRSAFIDGMARPLSNPNLVCGLVALSSLAAAILSRRAWPLVVSVAVGVVSVVLPIRGLTASAQVSFDSRSLTLTLLPLLLLAATGFVLSRLKIDRIQLATMIAVFLLLILGNALSWSDWLRYRVAFERVLRQNAGYVPIEQTPLRKNRYHWGWTSPILSVLWSGGCVRTVILNPSNTPWEPFDPKRSLPMQSYFLFSEPFRAAASQARACE